MSLPSGVSKRGSFVLVRPTDIHRYDVPPGAPLRVISVRFSERMLSEAVLRAVCASVLPQCRRTRLALRIGGAIYLTSAGAVHLLIGSLADWTSRLGPVLEECSAVYMDDCQRRMGGQPKGDGFI